MVDSVVPHELEIVNFAVILGFGQLDELYE